MITAMSLTNGTLTVIIDNGASILTARNDHPKWKEIVEAFKAGNEVVLQSLISLKAVVETYSVGQLSVNSTGVTFRGQPMHSIDSDRVMAFLRDGLPYKPIANYMARKMANPSARAIQQLYNFLEHQNMPINAEGKIIAYKGVCSDLWSVCANEKTVVLQGRTDSAGHIHNEIGATIEVERSSVDDDFRNGCSFGLHAGSLTYAKDWGKRLILVEIDPADVVSVPEDCNCQKLRCCKYKVIGEYTGALPNTYTNEFSSNEPDEFVPTPKPLSQVTAQLDLEKEDITKRCRAIVAEQLMLNNIDDIQGDVLLVHLGCDSLDGVELVMALEEEFNIEIGDNDLEASGDKPFSAIVDYIYRKVQERAGRSVVVDRTDNDENEGAYLKGMQDGIKDRESGGPARYLAGDQEAADTDLHAKYIDGYVNGYVI